MANNYDILKAALVIDKHALDDELMRQPQLMQQVSEEYANAISQKDFFYDQAKKLEGDLYIEMKTHIEGSGEKATEVRVKSEVERHPKRIEARDNYNLWVAQTEKWLGLKDSFMQRMFALRELASLWGANYFTSNHVKTSPAAKEYEANRTSLAQARAGRKEL